MKNSETQRKQQTTTKDYVKQCKTLQKQRKTYYPAVKKDFTHLMDLKETQPCHGFRKPLKNHWKINISCCSIPLLPDYQYVRLWQQPRVPERRQKLFISVVLVIHSSSSRKKSYHEVKRQEFSSLSAATRSSTAKNLGITRPHDDAESRCQKTPLPQNHHKRLV